MSTNFNKNAISSSGGFLPTSSNTPLDMRSRVNTIDDIMDIPNPYVGLMVYVVDIQKRYEITGIKEEKVGLSTVMKVNSYREMPGSSIEVDTEVVIPTFTVEVETLPPYSDATASITGTPENPVLSIGIPRGADGVDGAKGDPGIDGNDGEKGDPGSDGKDGKDGVTPNLTIGTIDTLPAGSQATASITGTAENPVLNIGIPKGYDGKDAVPVEPSYNTEVVIPTLSIGTVTTLPSGSEAKATITGTPENPILNLEIPRGNDGEDGSNGLDGEKGDPGVDGEDGVTPVFEVGTVETLEAGSDVIVTITGTTERPILNISIPRGFNGEDGQDGSNGSDGVSCTHEWNGTVLVVTSASGTSSVDLKGEKGDKGDTGSDGSDGKDGVTPNFTIGTVETLPAGSQATVSITGTAENPVLNLGIPRGDSAETTVLKSVEPSESFEDDSIVKPMYYDIHVIPDKFNTGCDESTCIETLTGGLLENGITMRLDTMSNGGQSLYIDFNKAPNNSIEGEFVFENLDLSGYAKNGIGNATGYVGSGVKLVYNNCKFTNWVQSYASEDSKIQTEFNNCSFTRFSGYDSVFNNCYFGGGDLNGDPMNPQKNCTFNNCYCSDCVIKTEEQGTAHIDGMQSNACINLYFNNCRWEVPDINYTYKQGGFSYVVYIEPRNGNVAENVVLDHCHLNGGGYYSIGVTPDVDLSNNIRIVEPFIGYCYYGSTPYYPEDTKNNSKNAVVDAILHDSLYVSSVWKDDNNHLHFLVTNDTGVDRTLSVYTNNGVTTFEVPRTYKMTEYEADTKDFADLPIDMEFTIDAEVDYAIFYDESKQIRFVNYENYVVRKPVLSTEGSDGKDGVDGVDGKDGKDGVTPNFTIGTVETLPAGSNATASITGTTEKPVLNLGIPRGSDGEDGLDGKDGEDGTSGVTVDQLSGKNILCIGDSMMAGNGWTGGYANCVIENHPEANVVNIAQSGATLIQNDTGNFIFNQLKAYHDAGREVPDLILLDGGGNDCLYRATIGTGKLDSCYINGWQTTMCDALEYLIYAAKTYYPQAKILYISNPLMMQWENTESIPSVPTPDVQLEYLVAREKVLQKWGIPQADIRRNGNLTSCMQGQIDNYFMDSIHLNEAGYRYVSPVIEEAIIRMFGVSSIGGSSSSVSEADITRVVDEYMSENVDSFKSDSVSIEGYVREEKKLVALPATHFYQDRYWNATDKVDGESSQRTYLVLETPNGELDNQTIYVSGASGGSVKMAAVQFLDSDNNELGLLSEGTGINYTDREITVPEGTKFIYVNGYRNNIPMIKAYINIEVASEDDLNYILEKGYRYSIPSDRILHSGRFSTNTNTVAEMTSYSCAEYVLRGEKKLKVYGSKGSTVTYPFCTFISESGNILLTLDDIEGVTESGTYEGVIVDVPYGSYKVYVCGNNYVGAEILAPKQDKTTDLSVMPDVLTEFGEKLQYKDKFAWKEMDTGYFAFSYDDSNNGFEKIVDLFEEMGVPCVFGVIPKKLNFVTTSGETILSAMLRCQANGGEILNHEHFITDEDGINDMEALYNKFVTSKRYLKDCGLNVRGILRAGGDGNICGDPRTDVWVRLFYDYSDLYGIEEPYSHARFSSNGTVDDFKAQIDKSIAKKEFCIFLFHGIKGLSHDNQGFSVDETRELVNYIQEKGGKITNYANVYDTFGSTVKELEIENRLKVVESIILNSDGNEVKY